jgi:hypothetical protein
LLVPIVTATVLEIDRTMDVMVGGLGDAALVAAIEDLRALDAAHLRAQPCDGGGRKTADATRGWPFDSPDCARGPSRARYHAANLV